MLAPGGADTFSLDLVTTHIDIVIILGLSGTEIKRTPNVSLKKCE